MKEIRCVVEYRSWHYLNLPQSRDVQMTRKNQIIQNAIQANVIDSNLTAIGIMDFDGLKQTVNDAYAAFSENFYHTFAVKANALVSVLTALRKYGMGAEVASSGELLIALKAGYIAQEIIFDSPAKTMADLRTCIENGISINIDNLQELARVDELMLEFPETESIIGFRINPQIGGGKISSTSTATATSKFGYALADGDNKQALITIYQQRPWLKSIHTHTGSQGCALELMATGVKSIADLAEEINEIIAVLQAMRKIQATVLAANEQYIASAAQDDKYRTEPPFKLQGSYRNMNKMAEKIVPVMTDNEIEQLIIDHYRGEAQTLTVGAEENLLKLAQLRQTQTPAQIKRWQQIKADFVRHQSLSDSDNPIANIASQIALLQKGLSQINDSLGEPKNQDLTQLNDTLAALELQVNVAHPDDLILEQSLSAFSQQMENCFAPLITALASHKVQDSVMLAILQSLSKNTEIDLNSQSDTPTLVPNQSKQNTQEEITLE